MRQHVRIESSEGPSTSQRVVEAVAETTGKDPTDVGPLYHAVDPEALDRLFAATPESTRGSGRVEFTFADCTVVVRGGDEVDVEVTEHDSVTDPVGDGEAGPVRAGADYGHASPEYGSAGSDIGSAGSDIKSAESDYGNAESDYGNL